MSAFSLRRCGLCEWALDNLAGPHAVSAYDAAFSELALRRGLVLITFDARLATAARSLEHPVMTAAPPLVPATASPPPPSRG